MGGDDNEPMQMPANHPALPEGAVRLVDWGVIRAGGAEAAKFLHGQLTQDIEHLSEGEARLAGYCSAKGRLLATFVVWRESAGDILLACSADVLPAVLKRLQMFVLRARCKLSDASAELPVWGLAGPAAESAGLIRLPAAVVDAATVPRALHVGGDVPSAAPLDIDAWRWLEVHSGVARIVAATSEQFVPQMVNLELVGGVNFQKGCYPGQEIVARSQYRGTLKRRGQVMHGTEPLQPGTEIFHSADADQPAGMVVLAGQWQGQHAALVEVKIAALHTGTLHAGSASGPLLVPQALPYALPAEAA
jgi:folate-binding protein YgfZ